MIWHIIEEQIRAGEGDDLYIQIAGPLGLHYNYYVSPPVSPLEVLKRKRSLPLNHMVYLDHILHTCICMPTFSNHCAGTQ